MKEWFVSATETSWWNVRYDRLEGRVHCRGVLRLRSEYGRHSDSVQEKGFLNGKSGKTEPHMQRLLFYRQSGTTRSALNRHRVSDWS